MGLAATFPIKRSISLSFQAEPNGFTKREQFCGLIVLFFVINRGDLHIARFTILVNFFVIYPQAMPATVVDEMRLFLIECMFIKLADKVVLITTAIVVPLIVVRVECSTSGSSRVHRILAP